MAGVTRTIQPAVLAVVVALSGGCSRDGGEAPAEAGAELGPPADVTVDVTVDATVDVRALEGCQQDAPCSTTSRDCTVERPDCASSQACRCVDGKLRCQSLLDRGGAIGRVWCQDGKLSDPFQCQLDATQCCRCTAGSWTCGPAPGCG